MFAEPSVNDDVQCIGLQTIVECAHELNRIPLLLFGSHSHDVTAESAVNLLGNTSPHFTQVHLL